MALQSLPKIGPISPRINSLAPRVCFKVVEAVPVDFGVTSPVSSCPLENGDIPLSPGSVQTDMDIGEPLSTEASCTADVATQEDRDTGVSVCACIYICSSVLASSPDFPQLFVAYSSRKKVGKPGNEATSVCVCVCVFVHE